MLAMKIPDINSIRGRLAPFLAAALWITLGTTWECQSGDWPRFLGPHQNGGVEDEALPTEWPASGPKPLWQMTVGSGFSGPIVVDQQVILFHRERNQEILVSLDASTGKEHWRSPYETSYRDDFGFDNGPRSTPTAHDGYVYTYGAQGRLQCTELKSGKALWHVDAMGEFEAPKGFFGIACSPLVEGDLVIINVGSPPSRGIVAFHRLTGKVVWNTSQDEASYSSPIGATIAGIRQALVFDREGLKAVTLSTGKIRSSYPWRPRIHASVNAASPVVHGDQVFLSTSYSTGAIVLDLTEPSPQKIWSNDQALSCHYGTPLYHRGFLYGYHGRQERGADLNCVDWKTGTVQWTAPHVETGTVTRVKDRLLILQENGELVLADAGAERYQERDRAQILPSGVRAYPAFANGIFFARSPKKLVAVQVR